jgi:hypothetical protein
MNNTLDTLLITSCYYFMQYTSASLASIIRQIRIQQNQRKHVSIYSLCYFQIVKDPSTISFKILPTLH